MVADLIFSRGKPRADPGKLSSGRLPSLYPFSKKSHKPVDGPQTYEADALNESFSDYLQSKKVQEQIQAPEGPIY